MISSKISSQNEAKGTLARTAFGGKCPHCGQGRLYKSFLKLADCCDQCDLDYGFADSGDGPAVFVIMIVGFLATGGVLYTEFTFEPPVWLHVIIWGPLTFILSLLFLYWLKGALIAQQYATRAKPGELVQNNSEPENKSH
jgi:uncharacterized protein (DUF983 family)